MICRFLCQAAPDIKSATSRHSIDPSSLDKSRFGFESKKDRCSGSSRRQTLPCSLDAGSDYGPESFEVPPPGGSRIARTPIKSPTPSGSQDKSWLNSVNEVSSFSDSASPACGPAKSSPYSSPESVSYQYKKFQKNRGCKI